MFSLWEKQSFLSCDVIIVGAGITGLSAAASMKELHPEKKIVVLEKGILPTGASTKNAGFACFGSISELMNDLNLLGQEGMTELVEQRWKGLEKTINRLGKQAIDLKVQSGYELIFDDRNEIIENIDPINELLHSIFKKSIYKRADHKISKFGFGGTSHLIENELEGQLDTGKLMSSLLDYCTSLGVRVHTGMQVDIIEEGEKVIVSGSNATFYADKVGICTNAFTTKLIDEPLDISPGRGIVLSVVPEQELKSRGTFHYEEGYYYFRDYNGKLLFGGGRNLDKNKETTTEFEINQMIKQKLISDIENIILPDQAYEIEMEWAGIMAFGENKKPIIKKVSDKIAFGVRLGGMGVAIGSLVGEELAKMLVD